MLRPEAVAGVVHPARIPTTPRWLVPREGLSYQVFTPSLAKEIFVVHLCRCVKHGQPVPRHNLLSTFAVGMIGQNG